MTEIENQLKRSSKGPESPVEMWNKRGQKRDASQLDLIVAAEANVIVEGKIDYRKHNQCRQMQNWIS